MTLWPRTLALLAVAALPLLVASCAGQPEIEVERVSSPIPAPAMTVTAEPSRLSLMQRVGRYGETRELGVEPDGTWKCDDCAGDGKSSTGQLTAAQNQELQRLLADPALYQEARENRKNYGLRCEDGLISTLVMSQGVVASTDCPGEVRTPITGAILALLVDATPAKATR
ncbi:hypothetical protein WEI85_17340 [Actinomycetes bacterium KLBMP 9797]